MKIAWLSGSWWKNGSTAEKRSYARLRGRGRLRVERLETRSFLVGVAFGGLEMGLQTSLDASGWDVASEESAEVEDFDWWMTDAESSAEMPMEFTGTNQAEPLPHTPAPWMSTWGDEEANLEDDLSATDWVYPFMGNGFDGKVAGASESFDGPDDGSRGSPVDADRFVGRCGGCFLLELESVKSILEGRARVQVSSSDPSKIFIVTDVGFAVPDVSDNESQAISVNADVEVSDAEPDFRPSVMLVTENAQGDVPDV